MHRKLSTLLALFAILGFTYGCSEPAGERVSQTPAESHGHDDHGHDGHDHENEGPHYGHLIELGEEEFHGELVHSHATHKVDVHLLDKTAKEPAPAAMEELTLNVVIDGQPSQYTLIAAPMTSDPSGKCSRFTLIDDKLSEALESKKVTVKLNVTINGKQYSGSIDHEPHEHHDH